MEKMNEFMEAQELVFKLSSDIEKVRTVMDLLGEAAYLNCFKLDEDEFMYLRNNHSSNVNLHSIAVDYLFAMNKDVNEALDKLSDFGHALKNGGNNEGNNKCPW